MEYLHDLGAKNGGTAGWAREMSGQTFRNWDSLAAKRAKRALGDRNEKGVLDAYMEMQGIQEALIAIAYADHHHPQRKDPVQGAMNAIRSGGTAQDGRVEECVALARSHPRWRDFLERRVRHQASQT